MSIWRGFRQEVSACLDLLLPPACLLCGRARGDRGRFDLCAACLAGIHPPDRARCRCCAAPFHDLSPADHLCPNCLTDPPNFTRVHVAGRHHGPLKEAVHKFKYRNHLPLQKTLAALLNECLDDELRGFRPDRVVPVPLHPRQLRRRGYNQAQLLARTIAGRLGAPLSVDVLHRTRETRSQQGLSSVERRRNLRNAFRAETSLAGEKVLLVDDVMTTGTTVRECSRMLQRAGAVDVRAVVVTRA